MSNSPHQQTSSNPANLAGADAIRWEAVASRDSRYDSIFLYGVNSTHIYCRPSCPSRRPRRDRVVFFESPAAAESSGYRSCKRCKPRDLTAPDSGAELVLKVCRLMDAAIDETISLEELGTKIGISPHHLQRTFRSITGITPRQYAAALRLNQFKASVREGADIAAAMYDAGYGSSSRLYERAGERMGMTPASYRRGGKGMNIDYTIASCRLGRLLVAATERGVCSVQFGDSDDDLKIALEKEYPAATIVAGDATLRDHIASILAHIDGSQPSLNLPLDLQATAFQLRVWEELRRIPYGATRSYAEVAASLGQPTATRAVARACATNPVALVTPCHRVVRSDGGLSGYRWGVERKQALLDREKRD